MLRFIVMRHAKSAPATVDLPDHERGLTARGRRDANGVARIIATRNWTPDRVLCSDSVRTRETWERMVEAFTDPPPVQYSRQLYLATVSDYEAVVTAESRGARTLMTLAHNPGCEDLVAHLSDTQLAMKTSVAVLLQSDDATWPEALEPGRFVIVDVISPPPHER